MLMIMIRCHGSITVLGGVGVGVWWLLFCDAKINVVRFSCDKKRGAPKNRKTPFQVWS
jgi:hypothetical protein